MLGLGGADDRAHPAQAALTHQASREPVDKGRELLVQRLLGARQVLDVGRAGIAGPHQGEDSRPGALRCRDQRLERVGAEQWVGGEGVGAEAGDRAPWGRRLADQRLGVGSGGDRHVAALAIGDDEQPGFLCRRADLAQRRPAGRPEPLEAGELGLDRDAGRPCSLDQRATVRRHGLGRALGGRGSAERPSRPGELRRVGVETEADLAAALFDERRKPICERGLAQPLTLVFSAEPAEKRGTLPPGIVIRSPVRGLTPWRGPRSATWNLPKPVKLTSPPPLSVSVIASSTASTASLARFLAAQPLVACKLVQKLSLCHVEAPPSWVVEIGPQSNSGDGRKAAWDSGSGDRHRPDQQRRAC